MHSSNRKDASISATIILIPGNMCDASLWDTQREAFADTGHRVIDADTAQDDTIEAMAARALAATRGAVIPVGFSMGGIIALEMARQDPARLAAMILLDTNAGADLPERAAVRPQQQQRVRDGELATIIRDELKPHYLAEQNRNNDALKKHLLDMAMGLGPDIFIQQSEALRTRGDAWGLLPHITCPVLVACGEEDALCPPAWHERMSDALPGAELHIIAGSGHMLPLEQPEQFETICINFLSNKTMRATL